MPVMRNFRKVLTRTQASYGLPAIGPVQPQLPRVLRAPGEVSPSKLGHAGQDAGVHRNAPGRADTRRNHRSDEAEKGAMNGEVLALSDLWAGDAQTSCDIAAGRNRAGVRREGCTAPTHWTSQENSADNRETASEGCF